MRHTVDVSQESSQPSPYVAPPSSNPFGAPPVEDRPLPWAKAVLVTVAVFLVAGVVALVVRSGESRPYPFGPWLVVGAVVAILASGPLLDAFGV